MFDTKLDTWFRLQDIAANGKEGLCRCGKLMPVNKNGLCHKCQCEHDTECYYFDYGEYET